jgi:hypothetical protein
VQVPAVDVVDVGGFERAEVDALAPDERVRSV